MNLHRAPDEISPSDPTSWWWRELLDFRYVLRQFVIRDLRVRYHQTAVGVLWALGQPFASMGVLTLVFGGWLSAGTSGVPYALFVYPVLVPWFHFSSSLSLGSMSLLNNAHLITKVYFPRQIPALSVVAVSTLDSALAAAAFPLLMWAHRRPIPWTLWAVAPVLLLQGLLTAALAPLLAALNAYYRDVKFVIPLALQLLFFLTPIITAAPAHLRGLPRLLYFLNPLAGYFSWYRWAALGLATATLPELAVSFISGILLTALASWAYRRLETLLVDVI